MSANERTMYYGKADVFVYRTYAKPLTGVKQIPESGFRGRDNVVFGMNIEVAFYGEKFLTSYTEGDNSLIVATDSMKNFIQAHAAKYEGSTMEGFIEFVSKRFLDKYDHIEAVEMKAYEIPFDPVYVPVGDELRKSGSVYSHSRNEYATAYIKVDRTAHGYEVVQQQSGIKDLHLIKVTGNSFYGYIQDEYTKLPEETDRNLFIYLDIHWKYDDVAEATGEEPSRYVAAEQVRDIATAVFHELNNNSIQHLIYHIGCQVLDRFPQLTEVSFESNNRTWLTIVPEIDGSDGKVYTEPLPPYGFQGFSVHREDLKEWKAKHSQWKEATHA